jgi:hypothetical protein
MSSTFISDRLDAAENIFFLRQLEYVKSKSYDILYPELLSKKFIPVSNEAGPGAETIVYATYDKVGVAKIIASYAEDLPRADVKGVENRSPVRSLGASYGYNIQEIRAAKLAGKPLQQRRADAAMRAVAQKEDIIGATGDADSGLGGFLNNTSVTNGAAAYQISATGGTPDQILAVLNTAVNSIVSLTYGLEMPTDVLLPINQYTYIASTARSANSDTTILEYFLQNNPFVQNVNHWYRLTGAGIGGGAGLDVMMTYVKSPEKVTFEIPLEVEQFAPQQRGLEFVVDLHARNGGVLWYYPLSASYTYHV